MNTAVTNATRLLLALLLLVPLVFAPGIFGHFTVSKALYARSLIEILGFLWLILLVRDSNFRPPRSWVLLAFGLYVLVALISAISGINVNNSIWSTYPRMLGVWDLAHWLLYVLVLVSIVRSATGWFFLLNGLLGVTLILCLIALTQWMGIEFLPSIVASCRGGATLGNPSYLSPLLVIAILVSAGFLVRSFLPPNEEESDDEPIFAGKGWEIPALRSFWFIVAVLCILVLAYTGSRGALFGLVAGSLGMTLALGGNSRALVPLALASSGILLAVGTLIVIDYTVGLPSTAKCAGASASGSIVGLTEKHLGIVPDSLSEPVNSATLVTRVESLKTGLLGFKERPILGWGPENFGYIFDRYSSPPIFQYVSGSQMDKAHNTTVEELATKGVVGILAFAFLWGTLVWAVVRRRRPDREEVVAYAILGALGGYFVQNQFLFDTPAGIFYWALLVAWIAGHENDAIGPRSERVVDHPNEGYMRRFLLVIGRVASSAFSPSWVRYGTVSAMFPLLVLSLYYLNYQPLMAAQTFDAARDQGKTISERLTLAESSFHTFPQLADLPRQLVIVGITKVWFDLTPIEKQQAAELIKREADLGLIRDSQSAPLLISTILFFQSTAQTTEVVSQLAPALQRLQVIAPDRVETHQLLAQQALLLGEYQEAIQISAAFEARAPGTEQNFTAIKSAAQRRLDEVNGTN